MQSIDVVIPCHNAGKYIEQSVQSALEQQGDFEILNVIIVDDRSTDPATLQALESLQSITRVKVISNTGPRGSAAARNEGIRHARGDWVAFLDADDWWPEDSISKRLKALTNYPTAEWIGGDFLELRRDGTWESKPRFERNLGNYAFLSPAFSSPRTAIMISDSLNAFLHRIPTITTAVMAKRELLLDIGGFNERLLRAQDNHLWLRLANRTPFVFVPHVVAYYRLHETNSTRSIVHAQEWQISALTDLFNNPEFSSSRGKIRNHIHGLHLSNSYELRSQSRFLGAAHEAFKAVLTFPQRADGWRSLAGALLRR